MKLIILNTHVFVTGIQYNFAICVNALDIIFYEYSSHESKKTLLTSASVTRTGSNGSSSGGVDHCSLCFTDPWINLSMEGHMDNFMNIFI